MVTKVIKSTSQRKFDHSFLIGWDIKQNPAERLKALEIAITRF